MKRIESAKNPQVKQWKKLLSKKERDKTGLFLIEGFHLVEEALRSGVDIVQLIVDEQKNASAKLECRQYSDHSCHRRSDERNERYRNAARNRSGLPTMFL